MSSVYLVVLGMLGNVAGMYIHRVNTIQRSHLLLISAKGIFPVSHVLTKCPNERPSPPENVLKFNVPGGEYLSTC